MEYCTCSWFITRKWDSLYSGFISSEFAITAEIQNILYPPPPLHSPPSSMQKWDKFDCFVFFFQRYQRNIFDIYCSCVGNFVKRMLTKEIWAPHFLMCFFSCPLTILPNLYFGSWPHHQNNITIQYLNEGIWHLW